MKKLVILACVMCVQVIAPSYAEDEKRWALGLGANYGDSIYKGVDSETTALPLVSYQRGNLEIQGPSVGYKIIDSDDFSVDAKLGYNGGGYKASDSSFLAGMDERKGTAEAGFSVGYETGYGDLELEFAHDIGSTHKGHKTQLGWSKDIPLSQQWMITPEASVTWQSADYNNYYYGVKSTEATANRAAYTAGSDTVWEVGVGAGYRIDQSQMIRLGASYQKYGNEITNSSIVDKDSSSEVNAMYVYRF